MESLSAKTSAQCRHLHFRTIIALRLSLVAQCSSGQKSDHKGTVRVSRVDETQRQKRLRCLGLSYLTICSRLLRRSMDHAKR